MNKKSNISISVIRRLPRYYRFLRDMKDSGVLRTSSRELSQKMGLTASQIRQDLNCFGEFGQQGYGYNVDYLYREICSILGLSQNIKAILVGAGNLGRAIATHMDFNEKGFELIGIFDNNEYVIGKKIVGIEIMPNEKMELFCKINQPEVAILCIPKESTGKLAELLISFGIKGFWNFSHYDFGTGTTKRDIIIENVHLGDSLMTLSYHMQDKKQ